MWKDKEEEEERRLDAFREAMVIPAPLGSIFISLLVPLSLTLSLGLCGSLY